MADLGFYTIDEDYIDHLLSVEPNLFHNAKPHQRNSRKYIGVVLSVGDRNYFAPLSSFKPKHKAMKNTLDFIKVGDYAVINLNCMIPAPSYVCHRVDFSQETDPRYRSLLLAEYRVIKQMRERIRKNAAEVYRHKIENGNGTKLAARCNDFLKLEAASRLYKLGL